MRHTDAFDDGALEVLLLIGGRLRAVQQVTQQAAERLDHGASVVLERGLEQLDDTATHTSR